MVINRVYTMVSVLIKCIENEIHREKKYQLIPWNLAFSTNIKHFEWWTMLKQTKWFRNVSVRMVEIMIANIVLSNIRKCSKFRLCDKFAFRVVKLVLFGSERNSHGTCVRVCICVFCVLLLLCVIANMVALALFVFNSISECFKCRFIVSFSALPLAHNKIGYLSILTNYGLNVFVWMWAVYLVLSSK